MITSVEQVKKKSNITRPDRARNYNEIVEYLNNVPLYEYNEQSLFRMKQLNNLFDNVCSKFDTILVGGTNGKSSTIHFAAKLLKEEGFRSGLLFSSHFLTYNERVTVESQSINNKVFTEILNTVIDACEDNAIKATAYEIMLISGFLHFAQEKIDVVLVEVCYGGKYDAASILNPKIAAITRVTEDHYGLLGNDLDISAFEMLEISKPGCWFISGEQSKLRLQKMKQWLDDHKVNWAMPIRKLATLPYIFEQLYGRSASLGERIAQIYIEDIKEKFSPFLRGNLLATQKGQRGRPTIEAKRHAELHPIKTLKNFWVEQFDLLRGRFELLDKEKPTILLDNASNIDAFTNLFLGIRLIHYQKPLKGLVVIVGLSKVINAMESIKLIRYLLKKVNGQVFFVPYLSAANPNDTSMSHDIHNLTVIAQELNLKAKAFDQFFDAFEAAKEAVDSRDGMVCITGSAQLVTEYWKQRGIKKLGN